MIDICNKIIRKMLLIANIHEDDEQIEVYVYGLLSFIYTALPLSILLIIACTLNRLFDMFIWITYFILLRKYAGGYHATHPLTCFLYSISLGSSSLAIANFELTVSPWAYVSITVLALFYFILFSPISQKIFSKDIRFSCKIKLCMILLISLCIFSIFSNYQIVFLHAVLCTLLLCIAEQIHKCYHVFMEESL